MTGDTPPLGAEPPSGPWHPEIALTEFDPDPDAVIDAGATVGRHTLPERLVLCFFQDVIDVVVRDLPVVATFGSEIGPNPAWVVGEGDDAVAVMHPGVGAPLAAAFLEEAIGAGARTVVAVGGAGALAPDLAVGRVIVPTAAVRDEGTSFHYLPPSRTVAADDDALATTLAFLTDRGVTHLAAPTWTTDALYRETRAKVARRRDEGCVVVEMETAAFFAVSRFRGVRFSQLLYAGDDLSGDVWDDRDWMGATTVRTGLFDLAVDLVRAL